MTVRTRTPSDLKWVANELAAVMGELERLERLVLHLGARRKQLERMRDSLTQVGTMLGAGPLVALVPSVQVHRPYGRRGTLVAWLAEVLQAAAPGAVSTASLVTMAERQYCLELPTPAARDEYRKNVLGRALRKLLVRDLVERLHDPFSTRGPGLWRWKTHVQTLEEVRALACPEAG